MDVLLNSVNLIVFPLIFLQSGLLINKSDSYLLTKQ